MKIGTKLKKFDNKDHTLKLIDGRVLGYREGGDPKGKPLFFFHGWPSSRYHGSAVDDAAKKLGIRVISVDRPGLGLSDYQDQRTLLDWPDDVVQLADSLKIKKFSVLGVSGGGPYSAVCAFKIPERLNNVGIVVGLAPTYIPENLNGMKLFTKLGWTSYCWHNSFAYFGSGITYFVARFLPFLLSLGYGTKRDRQIIDSIPGGYPAEAMEPFRHGLKGAVRDLEIYSHNWGFELNKIKKMIYLWYGKKDLNVPPAMGKYYANNLQSSKLHFYPNEGHMILRPHAEEILKTLINNANVKI